MKLVIFDKKALKSGRTRKGLASLLVPPPTCGPGGYSCLPGVAHGNCGGGMFCWDESCSSGFSCGSHTCAGSFSCGQL
jgi:hypothetical protein